MNPAKDEQDVIEQALSGDRAAFATLVERHQGAVYGYLRARLLQPLDAEDMTQEVFLRFYQGRHRFDRSQGLRPFLLGIARNLLREHTRRLNRRKEVAWTEMCLELEDMAEPGSDRYDDVIVYLPGCLESLGPSARQAMEMRYRRNLRLATIGQRLRRSEGAVKLLMYRARQALKRCLNGKLQNGTDGQTA